MEEIDAPNPNALVVPPAQSPPSSFVEDADEQKGPAPRSNDGAGGAIGAAADIAAEDAPELEHEVANDEDDDAAAPAASGGPDKNREYLLRTCPDCSISILTMPRQKRCKRCRLNFRAEAARDKRAQIKQLSAPRPPTASAETHTVLRNLSGAVKSHMRSTNKEATLVLDELRKLKNMLAKTLASPSTKPRTTQAQAQGSARANQMMMKSTSLHPQQQQPVASSQGGGGRSNSAAGSTANPAHPSSAQPSSAQVEAGQGPSGNERAAPHALPEFEMQPVSQYKMLYREPPPGSRVSEREERDGSSVDVHLGAVLIAGGDNRFAVKTYYTPLESKRAENDKQRASYEAYLLSKAFGSASLFCTETDLSRVILVVAGEASGATLRSLLDRPPKRPDNKLFNVKNVALAMLASVEVLHKQAKIAHGDVHPSNFLFNTKTGTGRLVDLDLAFEFEKLDANPYNTNGVTGKAGYQFRVSLIEKPCAAHAHTHIHTHTHTHT